MDLTLAERLDHLPENKRNELERVTRILFEEFEDAQKGGLSEKRKSGRILKLILFGSHACGDWADDRLSDAYSCFDLLVVVSTKTFADQRWWNQATERTLRERTVTGHLATPVDLIVHSIMDLNDQLARGRPFFVDIVRDGILLYETPGFPLAAPKPLDAEAARAETRRQFEYWFPIATRRFELAKEAIGRGYDKEAAFDLHQTVERLYHGTLNVLTLHSPKSHRLTCLRAHAERVAPKLAAVWPRYSRCARQCFARLDRAYVEARYSPDYDIAGEELAWLVERVTLLQEITSGICIAHLDGLEGAGRERIGPRHTPHPPRNLSVNCLMD